MDVQRRRVVLAVVVGVALVLAGFAYLTVFATGTVVVLVRDAPTDWAHVNVTFSEVRIHRANAAEEDGWIALTMAGTTVDLLSLQDVAEVLAIDRVPTGRYTQVRIVVTAVEGVFANCGTLSLRVPDGIIKIVTPFDVPFADTASVTIDFDLSQSIHEANGEWVFRPVLGSIVVS